MVLCFLTWKITVTTTECEFWNHFWVFFFEKITYTTIVNEGIYCSLFEFKYSIMTTIDYPMAWVQYASGLTLLSVWCFVLDAYTHFFRFTRVGWPTCTCKYHMQQQFRSILSLIRKYICMTFKINTIIIFKRFVCL